MNFTYNLFGFALGFFLVYLSIILEKRLKNKEIDPIIKSIIIDARTNPELSTCLELFLKIINKSELNDSNEILHKKDNGKGYTIWFGSDYFSFTVLDFDSGKFEATFKIGRNYNDLIVTHKLMMIEFQNKLIDFQNYIKPLEE